jgi:hypothetical protein
VEVDGNRKESTVYRDEPEDRLSDIVAEVAGRMPAAIVLTLSYVISRSSWRIKNWP